MKVTSFKAVFLAVFSNNFASISMQINFLFICILFLVQFFSSDQPDFGLLFVPADSSGGRLERQSALQKSFQTKSSSHEWSSLLVS